MVTHVLLDADGVLQTVAGGWVERARPYVGDRGRELLEIFWAHEGAPLVGAGDVVDALALALDQLGLAVEAAELYPLVWLRIDVVATSIDLVHRLREAGYGVHLGTNQTSPRAAHMRTALGYDDLFDVSVYSCDIGVAKPDPAYFVKAAELIGVRLDEVVFVDDKLPNVLAARSAGMAAEHWIFTDGVPVLEGLLEAHGVIAADRRTRQQPT